MALQMSNLTTRILEARARFHLLQSIHPIVNLALPTVENVKSGWYKSTSEAIPLDDITILRSDIKSLPTRFYQIDIDQVTTGADFERLIKAFDSLLGLFEGLVRDLEEPTVGASTPQDADCVDQFPKLVTLRNSAIKEDGYGADDPKNAVFDSSFLLKEQTSLLKLSKAIYFPPRQEMIAECRAKVESFGKVVNDIFPDIIGRWNPESQLVELKDTEIEFIKEAYAFSEASSSLFQLLVECISCEAKHVAELHLSGFHKRQLEMLLGHGEHDWIPACFSSSTSVDDFVQKFKERLRAHIEAANHQCPTIRTNFRNVELALDGLAVRTTSPSTLDYFVPEYRSGGGTQRLDRKGKKTVGVSLACSLFQLCGSPWLQHTLERDKILVFPKKSSLGQLSHWMPHVSCDLSLPPHSRSLSEDVAALGVLVLELEANCSAGWFDEDEDYETGERSNKTRLSRILKEWQGDLADCYRGVGMACSRFEQLVEIFDHPKIDPNLKSLAVLYKCIVNPLYETLVSDFGETARLFEGISGLSVPQRQKRASGTGNVVLYDDLESTERDGKCVYAEEFTKTMENNILPKITGLRKNIQQIGLAETVKGIQGPEKVRIAVLDTGIDPDDVLIKAATSASRIKEKKSWVGPIEDCRDKYGHGTHVTRLLLQMAPAAEIFVAKISENKNINLDDMGRIAEAIDWAVEKCDVHIISMSFGFEGKNERIDRAIRNASRADKLLFAAASNEGGNKGRSRPARDPKVICIHACDGKGNKGDMSPSPVQKTPNFTTLGIAIRSRWKKETVYKSGTSFATPVAAAIAADVLEFANFRCNLQEDQKALLYTRDGMLRIFEVMSRVRDKYDYIQPGYLWNGESDEKVAERIEAVLDEI